MLSDALPQSFKGCPSVVLLLLPPIPPSVTGAMVDDELRFFPQRAPVLTSLIVFYATSLIDTPRPVCRKGCRKQDLVMGRGQIGLEAFFPTLYTH